MESTRIQALPAPLRTDPCAAGIGRTDRNVPGTVSVYGEGGKGDMQRQRRNERQKQRMKSADGTASAVWYDMVLKIRDSRLVIYP